MPSRRTAVALVLLAFGVSAEAGTASYTCLVSQVYDLSETGALVPSVWEKEMKGSSFSVSRETGEIAGKVVPTLMAKSTRVVNKGSEKNSFKSVADFGEQFQLLEVQEFRKRQTKPFVASSMGGAGVVTGTCE